MLFFEEEKKTECDINYSNPYITVKLMIFSSKLLLILHKICYSVGMLHLNFL